MNSIARYTQLEVQMGANNASLNYITLKYFPTKLNESLI